MYLHGEQRPRSTSLDPALDGLEGLARRIVRLLTGSGRSPRDKGFRPGASGQAATQRSRLHGRERGPSSCSEILTFPTELAQS